MKEFFSIRSIIILFVLPIAITLSIDFIELSYWGFLYVLPIPIITGIWVFFLKIDLIRKIVSYLIYIVVVSIIDQLVFWIVYLYVIGGDII
jgi:hypothetical protein